jgi:hypothetical protein
MKINSRKANNVKFLLYEPRIKHTSNRSKHYFMNISRFIKIKRKKEGKVGNTTMWCVRVTTVEVEMQ